MITLMKCMHLVNILFCRPGTYMASLDFSVYAIVDIMTLLLYEHFINNQVRLISFYSILDHSLQVVKCDCTPSVCVFRPFFISCEMLFYTKCLYLGHSYRLWMLFCTECLYLGHFWQTVMLFYNKCLYIGHSLKCDFTLFISRSSFTGYEVLFYILFMSRPFFIEKKSWLTLIFITGDLPLALLSKRRLRR